MARPKKGVIPPQLRRFLFKKGKKRAGKRKRATFINRTGLPLNPPRRRRVKNPGLSRRDVGRLRGALARRRRASSPVSGRLYGIITATRGKSRLHYDGRHFSNKNAPRKFPTLELAATQAKALLRKYPILRKYVIEVRTSR